MARLKITYVDKINVIPVVTREEQATAEDFNEIKAVINSLVDEIDLVGLMEEAPEDGTPYVRQDAGWIVMPGTLQMVFRVEVPAGDVSERAAGAVGGTGTAGWTYAAAANPNDLQITHGLGRKFANVTVSYMDGTEQVGLMGSLAYTGLSAPSNNVLIIKGLSTKAFPLTINLIFS